MKPWEGCCTGGGGAPPCYRQVGNPLSEVTVWRGISGAITWEDLKLGASNGLSGVYEGQLQSDRVEP